MRKLIMKMSISLDGFVGGPKGENDWVFKTGDEESAAWSVGKIREAGLIIMGRKSFENMAPYWPTAPEPFATPMNEIPKVVFTQKGFAGVKLTNAEKPAAVATWNGARVVDGDLADEIRKLKAEAGKPIMAIGGAGFMRSLIETGLIDEYALAVHPVALGKGLSIFNEVSAPRYLKLVDTKIFPGGTMAKTFRPA